MKILQFIFLSIILASCGTKKIQLVKTDRESRVIIERSIDVQGAVQYEHEDESINSTHAPVEYSSSSDNTDNFEIDVRDNKPFSNEAAADNETIQKVKLALQAERKALSSRNQLIVSTATLPLTFLFPPIFLLSLIAFILGAVNFGKSNNARYITPDGERYLSTSKIFLTISSVIITIIVLLVGLALLFFFL